MAMMSWKDKKKKKKKRPEETNDAIRPFKTDRHEIEESLLRMEDSKYMCPVSDCLYSESENSKHQLATHVRKSHPTKSLYMCRRCSKCCCRLKRIRRHVEKKHSTDIHGETLFSVHVPYYLNEVKFQILNGKFRVYCSFCDYKTKDARKYNQHFLQRHNDCLSVCRSEIVVDNECVEIVSDVDDVLILSVENGLNSPGDVTSCELKESLHMSKSKKAHEVDCVVIEDGNMEMSSNVCQSEMAVDNDCVEIVSDVDDDLILGVENGLNSSVHVASCELKESLHVSKAHEVDRVVIEDGNTEMSPNAYKVNDGNGMQGSGYLLPKDDTISSGFKHENSKKKSGLVYGSTDLTTHIASSLNSHVKPSLGRDYHRCVVCGKGVKDLANHMVIHGEPKHVCSLCPFKSVHAYSLKLHMLVHYRIGRFKCEICERRFNKSDAFTRHKLLHELEEKIECEICKRPFKSSNALKRHINLVHFPVLKFECDTCKKCFKASKDLKYHILYVHSLVRSFECDICKKRFKSPNYLRLHHKFVHFEVKKFECHICKKLFKRETELKAHFLVHYPEGLHLVGDKVNPLTSDTLRQRKFNN